MSNIARLFLSDPEIASLLRGMYLMCGKFSEWDFRPWSHAHVTEKEGATAPLNQRKPVALRREGRWK